MSGNGGTGGVSFCGQCGARSDGTPFCRSCGAATASTLGSASQPVRENVAPEQTFAPPVIDPHATMPQGVQAYPQGQTIGGMTPPPVYPAAPTKQSGNRSLWIGGAVLVTLLIVGGIVGFLVLGGKGHSNAAAEGTSYTTLMVRYLTPVVNDNAKLAYGVATLSPSSSPSATQAAVSAAESDIQSAQQSVSSLNTPAAETTLNSSVNAALTSENDWLKTVATVLGDPSSPLASQVAGLGEDLKSKFADLGTSLPTIGRSSLPDSTQIVAYASAVTANDAANQAITQFDNQVSSLLDQSASSYQQVNDFYNQLSAAANGGPADFTVAQAEQEIGSIISNRNSLQAAAQALNAPTPGAQAVAADLVAAFSASLKDDNDLSSCLNEQNYGTIAYIYSSCLSSTGSDSSAATTAKQTFVNAYNQLRATVGQAAASPQF
jgi:hypothetical protein